MLCVAGVLALRIILRTILAIGGSIYKRCVVFRGIDTGDRMVDHSYENIEPTGQYAKLLERFDSVSYTHLTLPTTPYV